MDQYNEHALKRPTKFYFAFARMAVVIVCLLEGWFDVRECRANYSDYGAHWKRGRSVAEMALRRRETDSTQSKTQNWCIREQCLLLRRAALGSDVWCHVMEVSPVFRVFRECGERIGGGIDNSRWIGILQS
ncbi:hypothetical protein BC832DRAFT_544897 [Gaertneriomyces semiglobifer]|nr:hypothetical protein BC832DRAFT_544897 [Gaertneriomyces semiglobifer]